MTSGKVVSFTGMTVETLREWRERTLHEETVISYWRRLIQGRLDVLTEHTTTGQPLTPEDLSRVLARHQVVSRGKITNVGVTPTGVPDLPDLPAADLVALWEEVPDGDTVTDLIDRLRAVETILGDRRAHLHDLLDSSAKELATRYVDDPAAVRAAWSHRPTP